MASWTVVGALRQLLLELADLLPPAPMPLDDRAGERHRVFRALAEVLGSLGPTVLVLEHLGSRAELTGLRGKPRRRAGPGRAQCSP